MSCCDDCGKNNAMKETRVVIIDFGEPDTLDDRLIGQCFTLEDAFFRTTDTDAVNDERYVKVSKTGNHWSILVFLRRLPFDALEASVQFDPSSGKYATKTYMQLNYRYLGMNLTVEPVQIPLWKQIGSGMFRIRNYTGVIDVLNRYSVLDKPGGDKIKKYAKSMIDSEKWPMLLIIDGSNQLAARTATAVEIPNWRNDQAWL